MNPFDCSFSITANQIVFEISFMYCLDFKNLIQSQYLFLSEVSKKSISKTIRKFIQSYLAHTSQHSFNKRMQFKQRCHTCSTPQWLRRLNYCTECALKVCPRCTKSGMVVIFIFK